jgi:thymidylate kinase
LWDQPESGSITVKVIERPSGLVGSAMRLVKALALFWAGYLRTVRPELRRNGVVVCDRWAFGYLAKPEELRYFGPRWLAVLSVRMLPKPDLVVSLNASPDIVVARKPELTTHEAAIDARAWSGLPVPGLVQVDAERSLDAIVKEILELGGLENREHQN